MVTHLKDFQYILCIEMQGVHLLHVFGKVEFMNSKMFFT